MGLASSHTSVRGRSAVGCPERPGHAPWDDARRLRPDCVALPSTPARGCSAAGRLERGGRTPCVRRPTIESRDALASAPPTPARGCSAAGCPERQGHAPWGDARRLEGQDAALQPLAAEEGVGVGLKPRRPDNAFIPHHAQMRKSIEEAQVTLGNRDLTRRALG